jgi:hypothetical protein
MKYVHSDIILIDLEIALKEMCVMIPLGTGDVICRLVCLRLCIYRTCKNFHLHRCA